MQQFEVWSEGYAATGDRATAMYHGAWSGKTFADACERCVRATMDMSYFKKDPPSYWGCRFFDNEKDARKSFG